MKRSKRQKRKAAFPAGTNALRRKVRRAAKSGTGKSAHAKSARAKTGRAKSGPAKDGPARQR